MREAMEKVFGRFPRLFREEQLGAWLPAVDVFERDDNVIVKVDLPGVDKKNVRIFVTDEEITIQGEMKREEEVKEKNYYRSERAYGKFSRTIPLPVAVDRDKAKASFKDGVLEVVIPKAKGAQARHVEITPE
jgi:HSP20 family protein